ncbi:hypothetical protein Vadar_017655 [Vaccinium darrowii]|nr:hypothetical protein Vadar_017655 [Vaccinium darrowii]
MVKGRPILLRPVQAERANESGKRNTGELDDGDYRPSEDENDNDYDHESDDSFEEEVSNMGPGLRTTQSNPDQQRGSSMISERATRSRPQPDMDTNTQDMHTQALPSAQPQSEPLAENDVALKVGKGRGPTRGIMAQRLIDKDGRLRVPIPPQFCAPIGEHATKMASKIGYEVRTNVIDLGVPFNPGLSLQLSAIKTLSGTNYEVWKESLEVNLAIMNLDLAIREEAPPKLTAESSAEVRAYYERWEHSNRTCLMFMKCTMDKSIKQCVPDNENAKAYLAAIEVKSMAELVLLWQISS